MILGAALVVIILAFLALKVFEGVLGFAFHGFGWIIAIGLIYYWYQKDHAGVAASLATHTHYAAKVVFSAIS